MTSTRRRPQTFIVTPEVTYLPDKMRVESRINRELSANFPQHAAALE
jgi:hypothetical protein